MKPNEMLGMAPKYEYALVSDGVYVVRVTPPTFLSAKPALVNLTADQYKRFLEWRRGPGLIQDILPDLSRSEREKLISGTML